MFYVNKGGFNKGQIIISQRCVCRFSRSKDVLSLVYVVRVFLLEYWEVRCNFLVFRLLITSAF